VADINGQWWSEQIRLTASPQQLTEMYSLISIRKGLGPIPDGCLVLQMLEGIDLHSTAATASCLL
jgi:hypothetical protein